MAEMAIIDAEIVVFPFVFLDLPRGLREKRFAYQLHSTHSLDKLIQKEYIMYTYIPFTISDIPARRLRFIKTI
jgi:hypothetical protein